MFSTIHRSCSYSTTKKTTFAQLIITLALTTPEHTAHTFSKAERLKSRKLIADLFKGGHSYLAYPFRVVWLPLPAIIDTGFPAQVAIAAPKRTFKTAVARNRIKRLVRETYRLQKNEFYAKLRAENQQIGLLLMYVAKTEIPLGEIEAGMKKVVRKFPGK